MSQMSHRAFTELTDAGFSEQQVEALSTMSGESHSNVATKTDISRLEAALQALELRITMRLGGMIVAGVAIIAVLTRL
ncbi:MAG: hypothetical protein OXH07_04000 [Chloroflexi bacterium]|nr:hypothetical protein [Chloroflexota bacterium]